MRLWEVARGGLLSGWLGSWARDRHSFSLSRRLMVEDCTRWPSVCREQPRVRARVQGRVSVSVPAAVSPLLSPRSSLDSLRSIIFEASE
jgi:hypothetical protein